MFKRLNCAIIAVLVSTLCAVIMALMPGVAFWGIPGKFDGFLLLFVCIFLFYMIQIVVKKADIERFVEVFIWIGVVASIYGLMQRCGLDPLTAENLGYRYWSHDFKDQPGSTFGNRAFFGLFLVTVIPLALYKVIKCEGLWKWVYVGVLALLLFMVIVIKARAAFVGVVIASGYFAIMCRRYKLVCTVIVVLVLLGVFLPNSPVKRLIKTDFDCLRIQDYNVGLEIIRSYPLHGVGPDNLPLVFKNYSYLIYPERGNYNLTSLHNEWLDILVRVGIVGLVAWIWFYFEYFRLAWKGRGNIVTVALTASVIGYLVNNQFSYGTIPNIVTFWYLLGFTVITCRK